MLESPRYRIRGRDIGLAIAGLAVLLLAAPVVRAEDAAGLEDITALTRRVSEFAGAPARLDPRALVPRCPAPRLAMARADLVRVDCVAPAWTLYAPLMLPPGQRAQATAARPAIRRGETVLVEAGGPGFAVAIEAVAERDADGTRVALKGPTGRRFTATIAPDGSVRLIR